MDKGGVTGKLPIRKEIQFLADRITKLEASVNAMEWGSKSRDDIEKRLPQRDYSCICGNKATVVFIDCEPFKTAACKRCGRDMQLAN